MSATPAGAAGTDPAHPAPRTRRVLPAVHGTALARRVTGLLVTVSLLFVLAGATAVWATVNLSDARVRLADHLDPAAVRTADLLAALVDQETGVRGYALTSEPEYLDPWESGQTAEAAAVDALRRLLADEPDVARLLDGLLAGVERWRTDAAVPIIDAVRAGQAVDAATIDASRAAFDTVRSRQAALDERIGEERAAARDTLDADSNWLSVALVVLGLSLLASVVLVFVELRRVVLRPLAHLVEDTRVVAAGDLDHAMQADGPRELRELARSVDAMRQRIVAELRTVDANRAELTRSNAELEQFAYVASHDLQEPLRKVASFCQMLERRYGDQLDERGHQYIAFAVDGAKRMQDLINDLLSFSRVGRAGERFAVVALDDVAGRAQANVSRLADEQGATITVAPLPTVWGDRTLLVGLFQNLLSNAIKFRGDDAPVVSVDVTPAGDDGWEFAVTDNGIGIDPQYHDRVFVIFQRLHSREDYEGTGIGLALCRKIVEAHGGRMWIDTSDADVARPGTTVRFTLPVPTPIAPDPDDAPHAGAPSEEPSHVRHP